MGWCGQAPACGEGAAPQGTSPTYRRYRLSSASRIAVCGTLQRCRCFRAGSQGKHRKSSEKCGAGTPVSLIKRKTLVLITRKVHKARYGRVFQADFEDRCRPCSRIDKGLPLAPRKRKQGRFRRILPSAQQAQSVGVCSTLAAVALQKRSLQQAVGVQRRRACRTAHTAHVRAAASWDTRLDNDSSG